MPPIKYFYLGLLIICLGVSQSTFAKQIGNEKNDKSHLSANRDSLTPKQVIIKFLKWYKINLHKANSFPILVKDSLDNFMVNRSASNKYLSLLKSSGCLSSGYIACWKSFFDDKSTGLKNNPVNSDIPEDFDLDFVLITQEPEVVLNHIAEMIFETISERTNDMVIGVRGPKKDSMFYKFEMHRSAAGWQIEYISTANFDQVIIETQRYKNRNYVFQSIQE